MCFVQYIHCITESQHLIEYSLYSILNFHYMVGKVRIAYRIPTLVILSNALRILPCIVLSNYNTKASNTVCCCELLSHLYNKSLFAMHTRAACTYCNSIKFQTNGCYALRLVAVLIYSVMPTAMASCLEANPINVFEYFPSHWAVITVN